MASLIGLGAECTGATSDCPRSGAYRATVLATPLAAAVLLVCGTAWSVRRRTVRPLVLAEALVLALVAVIGAFLGGPGIGTVVLLLGAAGVARLALRTGA